MMLEAVLDAGAQLGVIANGFREGLLEASDLLAQCDEFEAVRKAALEASKESGSALLDLSLDEARNLRDALRFSCALVESTGRTSPLAPVLRKLNRSVALRADTASVQCEAEQSTSGWRQIVPAEAVTDSDDTTDADRSAA